MGAITNINAEELRARYLAQNTFGNNLRVGGGSPVETGGGVPGVEYAGSGASTLVGRAVDRAPKAEMVNFNEYLPAQAGYESGISTRFLMA